MQSIVAMAGRGPDLGFVGAPPFGFEGAVLRAEATMVCRWNLSFRKHEAGDSNIGSIRNVKRVIMAEGRCEY
jgi:hypothetical protein